MVVSFFFINKNTIFKSRIYIYIYNDNDGDGLVV